MKGLSDLIGRSLSLVITGGGLFLALGFLWVLLDHYWNRQVHIDAIELPGALQEGADLTGTTIARRLKDEFDLIGESALTIRQAMESSFVWDQPDLEVPGTPYTLQGLKRLIGALLDLPGRRISGELTRSAGDLLLRLRLDGRVISRDRPIDIGDLSGSLRPVAEDALRAIDPFTLAAYYKSNGDNDAAVRTIRRCLREPPGDDDAWAYNLWGVIQLEDGRDADAERSFRAAIFRDPRFSPSSLNLVPILTAQGKFEEAQQLFWRLKALARPDATFYARWAEVYVQQAHATSSEASLAQIKGGSPLVVERLQFVAKRDYARALALYQQALALEPGHAVARIGLSRLHLAQLADAGDPAEFAAAEQELRQAILVQPSAALAYIRQAAEFERTDRRPDECRAALAPSPGRAGRRRPAPARLDLSDSQLLRRPAPPGDAAAPGALGHRRRPPPARSPRDPGAVRARQGARPAARRARAVDHEGSDPVRAKQLRGGAAGSRLRDRAPEGPPDAADPGRAPPRP